MIEVVANPVTVPNEHLTKLLYSNELIKALARQVVAGQVEGHLDMMSDCPQEYTTFGEVEACVKNAKETVVDYVADLLAEFETALYAEIANVNITVSAVKFTRDGAEDADVLVS